MNKMSTYFQIYMDIAHKDFFLFLLITLCFIWFINFFVILPMAFKFFIIPKIEKKIGRKLEYRQLIYRIQIFSKWFAMPFEVGMAIVFKYLKWKITGQLPGDKLGFNPKSMFALINAPYDIRQATCVEIIMGFYTLLNTLVFIFLVIVPWIFPK